MDLSKLLGHLRDIHDAPDDGRDFVAFEKRPEMIAAGVSAKDFDRFDFGDKPAVAREISALSLGGPVRPPEPQAPIERPIMESNPKGFVANGDMMAAMQSDYEQLPQHFLANNAQHFTRINGRDVATAPRQDLVDAITDISRTESGRQMLARARDDGLKQRFIYDPEQSDPAFILRDAVIYNPARFDDYRSGKLAGPDGPVPGDEHESATFPTIVAHEVGGHTVLGRKTFGFPEIRNKPPYDDPILGFVVPNGMPHEAELRAVRDVENRYRKSRGLPFRRWYYRENDVF